MLESKLHLEHEQKELIHQSLQQQIDENKRVVLQVEKLEDELRRKDDEVARMQRSSVACTAEAPPSCVAVSLCASPQVDATDAGGSEPRRRLFTSMANEPSAAAAYPPPAPQASGATDRTLAGGPVHRKEPAAMVRASSSSSVRPVEEEPPQGVVASLRKSFESRSASQSRINSQPARQRQPQAKHKERGPQTVTTAPAVLTSPSQAPWQRDNKPTTTFARGRAGNPSAISTVRVPASEIDEFTDFGMSPIKFDRESGPWGRSMISGASQKVTATPAGDASNAQGSLSQRIC